MAMCPMGHAPDSNVDITRHQAWQKRIPSPAREGTQTRTWAPVQGLPHIERGPNMGTMRICVGNYGSYASGYLVDTWIDLPMPPDLLESRLEAIRREAQELTGGPCEEVYVSDYDGIPFGMPYGGCFSEYSRIDHLNVIAKMMEDDPNAAETVQGALDCGIDGPDGLLELANWLENADEIPYYSYNLPFDADRYHMTDEEKFGYSWAYLTGLMGQLEELKVEEYFDFERYGETMGQDCSLGDDGYVDNCLDMPRCDLGWEDLESAHMLDWSGHEDVVEVAR